MITVFLLWRRCVVFAAGASSPPGADRHELYSHRQRQLRLPVFPAQHHGLHHALWRQEPGVVWRRQRTVSASGAEAVDAAEHGVPRLRSGCVREAPRAPRVRTGSQIHVARSRAWCGAQAGSCVHVIVTCWVWLDRSNLDSHDTVPQKCFLPVRGGGGGGRGGGLINQQLFNK